MPYPVSLTQFAHNLKIKVATSGCCLVTLAQHWIQAHPWGWLENFRYWAWLPLFANGYLDFLTSWTQKVQIGCQTSFTLALSTGALQGYALPPYCLHCTHNCAPRHHLIVKYTDDTTIIGHITNKDKSSYREGINNHADWCTENNQLLNIGKNYGADCWFLKNGIKDTLPCLHQWSWGGVVLSS